MSIALFQHMILQGVPDQLVPRVYGTDLFIGILLFSAFSIIALTRVVQPNAYTAMIVANGKMKGLLSYLRESFPLNKPSSTLLLVNYLLSSSAIMYLLIRNYEMDSLYRWLIVGLVPVALFSWSYLSLLLTQWITNERAVFREPLAQKVLGAQLLGIFFFVCAVVWALNSGYDRVFTQLVLGAFIAESSFRFVKSITSVLRVGVSWYYIILYFCTLEILPLYVTYYLLQENFIL